jgi:(2R)-3-sulfolactate dehydrogenase (NADP+)
MVEAFAAGLTGSVNSLDVKGLKAAEGPPHDLGQFYVLIDPGAHDPAFAARIARVAEAIADEPEVRIPGVPRRHLDPVEVPDALWAKTQSLAALNP